MVTWRHFRHKSILKTWWIHAFKWLNWFRKDDIRQSRLFSSMLRSNWTTKGRAHNESASKGKCFTDLSALTWLNVSVLLLYFPFSTLYEYNTWAMFQFSFCGNKYEKDKQFIIIRLHFKFLLIVKLSECNLGKNSKLLTIIMVSIITIYKSSGTIFILEDQED